jgi:hypothetical protein
VPKDARELPQLVRIAKEWDEGRTALQALGAALPEAKSASHNAGKSPSSTTGASSPPSGPAGKRNGAPHPGAVEGTPERQAALAQAAALSPELQEAIRRPASGDRSKALFKAIATLIKEGLEDADIEKIIYAHPEGIGEKYADREDLDAEIARVRAKTTTRPVVKLQAGMCSGWAPSGNVGASISYV